MLSESSNDLKVVIVGGGPVGLMTAIQLHHQGIESVVLEKRSYPVDKVCGEGVMPLGSQILKDLGLLSKFKAEYFTFFSGIEYFENNKKTQTFEFNDRKGMAIRRVELSRVLREECRERRIEVLENTEYLSHEKTTNEVLVTYAQNGVEQRIKCLKLIAADGIHSSVLKDLKINTKKQSYRRMGLRWHVSCKPWSKYVQVYWGHGVEAYVTPVGPSQIEIALLYFPQLHKGEKVEDLMNYFPFLQNKIKDLKLVSSVKGYGPFPRESEMNPHPYVHFVGDSFAFIDGITGDGISFGFLQAYLLAQEWGNRDKVTFFVRKYFRTYKLMTKTLVLLSYFPKLRYFVNRLLPSFLSKKIFKYHTEHGFNLYQKEIQSIKLRKILN